MTIGVAGNRVSFNCDGVTALFPIPLQAYLAADFTVILAAPLVAGGAQTTLTLNSNYAMATNSTDAPPKWALTTTVVYAVGYSLTVFVSPQQVQQTSYVQGQAFPSAAVQANIDRLTQMVQRLQDQITRSIRAPDGDVLPGMLLPAAVFRQLQYLVTDANGNITTATALPGTSNTAQSLGLVLTPITPAEAAALVVPVQIWLEPGNVLRYGINAVPGTTNMTAAIQAAVNQAVNTGVGAAPVYIPTGVYYVNAPISETTGIPLHIYGDGQEMSVIYQHTDADVFNITASAASSGRLILHDLSFVAITGLGVGMTTGAAIRYHGQVSGPSPVRTVDIRRVTVQGSAGTDEFKFGIWMASVNQPTIDTYQWNGVPATTNSTAIHLESDVPYSIALNINNAMIYSCNYAVDLLNNSYSGSGGIENVSLTNSEIVDCVTGVIAQNTIGIGTYPEPKITLVNVHINSRSYCVFISQFIQIQIAKCLFYRFGALNNSAFVHLVGCQQFDIDLIAQISDATDCPVLMMDGTTNAVAHGIIDGVFSGKSGSGFPVVHALATSTLGDIIVRGIIRFGYTRWLPSLSALPYTPGGSIQLNASSILATDTDNINPQITPTGTTPNMVLDLTYVQCGLATINLASGTIATILGNRPGQRITLGCTNAGVILANNAGQAMPGGANFTFGAGQTIDLYREGVLWLAVSRQ
jgi:Pectate lyase superfamily protein